MRGERDGGIARSAPSAGCRYLGLYNLAYVFDDALVVATAVATLSRRRIQQRGARVLQLVSGSVMLGVGALLWLAPGWLRG